MDKKGLTGGLILVVAIVVAILLANWIGKRYPA